MGGHLRDRGTRRTAAGAPGGTDAAADVDVATAAAADADLDVDDVDAAAEADARVDVDVDADAGEGEGLARRLRGARRALRARERHWRAGRATSAAAVRYAHGAVETTVALLAGRPPEPSDRGVWLSEALLDLSVARPELAVSLAWRHEVDLAWLDEAVSRLRDGAEADPADADRALAVADAWLTDAEAQSAAGLD